MSDLFPASDFHAVRFYESDEAFCQVVAAFIGDGLRSDEAALVIATPEHRDTIQAELRARDVDVVRAQSDGQLLFLDAAETLNTFMAEGMPDEARFVETCGGALGRLRHSAPVRAYGEMVDLLMRAGHSVAALQLEMLWNKLAAKQRFSLMCGYAMASFYRSADFAKACADVVAICDQHSHVITEAGQLVPRHDEPVH